MFLGCALAYKVEVWKYVYGFDSAMIHFNACCLLHCLFCVQVETRTPYMIVKYFRPSPVSCSVIIAELTWPHHFPYAPKQHLVIFHYASHTQEVISSNLSWTPAILTEGFCGFPQSFWVNTRLVPSLGNDHFLANTFQFIMLPPDTI
jgi:hypothetical protein